MAKNPMKEKHDRFLKNLMICGMVDERKIAYAAGARTLPNGEFGLSLLCINRNMLTVYALDIHQTVGDKLYEIPLNQITQFKASAFLLNSYLIFQYEGFQYKFVDFGGGKPLIDTIRYEMTQ